MSERQRYKEGSLQIASLQSNFDRYRVGRIYSGSCHFVERFVRMYQYILIDKEGWKESSVVCSKNLEFFDKRNALKFENLKI